MAKTTNTDKTENANEIAVVEKKNTAIAMAPDFMDAEDFGGGFEGIDKDSFAIPFIQLLQKMSPLVDEDDPKHVPGAKAGMFYNTVTGKLYKSMTIIPSAFKRSYVRWGGREGADGGYKGEYTPEQIAEMVENKEILNIEGNLYAPDEDGLTVKNVKKNDYYADTRSHYVIAIDDETGESGIAVIPCASTQIKASRTLMTLLNEKKIDTPQGKRRPATFANLVKMTSVAMSNAKGSWAGFKFELAGLVADKQLYDEAKQFYLNINSGKIKADFAKADNDTHADEGSVGEGTTADNF